MKLNNLRVLTELKLGGGSQFNCLYVFFNWPCLTSVVCHTYLNCRMPQIYRILLILYDTPALRLHPRSSRSDGNVRVKSSLKEPLKATAIIL